MKRNDFLELESHREMPKGVSPHNFIIRLQGQTYIDILGRYWPARVVVAVGIVAIAAVCLLARMLYIES